LEYRHGESGDTPHEALAKCGRGEFLLDIQQEKSIKTRGNKNSVFMIFLIVYLRIGAAGLRHSHRSFRPTHNNIVKQKCHQFGGIFV